MSEDKREEMDNIRNMQIDNVKNYRPQIISGGRHSSCWKLIDEQRAVIEDLMGWVTHDEDCLGYKGSPCSCGAKEVFHRARKCLEKSS